MSFFYSFCAAVVKPFIKVLFPYKVVNGNSLPKEGAYIICSNHISNLDPILIAVTQNRQVNFIAKKELFQNKTAAFFMSALGAFPVDRSSTDRTAMKHAFDVLGKGDVLGIFYEGTRSKTGELLQPKAGVAMIAMQADTPVIPCCITAENKKVKLFNKIKITYGEPLTMENLGINTKSMSEVRSAVKIIDSQIKDFREKHLEDFQK